MSNFSKERTTLSRFWKNNTVQSVVHKNIWRGAGAEGYLTVLHPVYEVSADDVGLVGEGVVRTKHLDNILVSSHIDQDHCDQTCPEDSFLLRIF